MNSPVVVIARILLSSIFIISGIRKVLAFGMVSGMMAGKGFPMPDAVLMATIALELVGGVMLIANWNAPLAAWALAAFTLAAGIIFHGFWTVWSGPPAAFVNELNHFLKNIAIVGGLLMVAGQTSDQRIPSR